MRRVPFEEKTNEERKEKENKKTVSERDGLIEYLKLATAQTKDYNLKYDIHLCIELLQGKENQKMADLERAVVDLASENEELTKECDLLRLHAHAQLESGFNFSRGQR
ncbi:hypothetical protein NECID01_1812 [Nematocida sp. AWRm77]|nr:hypothetical protein NECID01_1812 [Nematocida sp. AWRm77]